MRPHYFQPRPSAAGGQTHTWHFTAHNVRDFAFAAGPTLRWDASGYKGILIEDLYRPSADKWGDVNRIGREAIKYYSEQWYPYPYSHATTVEGPVEGMEYPLPSEGASISRRSNFPRSVCRFWPLPIGPWASPAPPPSPMPT